MATRTNLLRGMQGLFALCLMCCLANAQSGETPNYANSATLPPGASQASKFTNSAVNLFTGVPAVSIPIYNYKNNNGLALAVSLEYTGGSGIQVGEEAGIVGLGWYLSTGGGITRTVRGMPDDRATYGWLYAAAIPTDFRNDASKYYHDSIDSQCDIFQYNFPGHSGKFYFGRDSQIVVVPYSKIRIVPTFQSGTMTLKSFRIIAENGVKYDFEPGSASVTDISPIGGNPPTPSGNYGVTQTVAWDLARMISPFYTDTIKFSYAGASELYSWRPPQTTFVNNATGVRKTPTFLPGTSGASTFKISEIELPDKTKISFVYSSFYKYANDDFALSKIKISDTAFRFGYLLDYQSSYVTGYRYKGVGGPVHTSVDSTRLLLRSVIPFTSKEKQPGYHFEYNYPLFPRPGYPDDTIYNKRDHWGYYNASANKDSLVPQVNGYSWGADRDPDDAAKANALARYHLPTGGYIFYTYEPNKHYPYTRTDSSFQVAPATPSQTNIRLNQVFNSRHQLVFTLDKSVSRYGAAPVAGPGDLNVSIKSTNGSTTYLTTNVSLYDLFYTGIKTWKFNLPNGVYRLETSIPFVTGVTGSFPINISWEKKIADTTQLGNTSGGIRVKSVYRTIPTKDTNVVEGVVEQFKYNETDGRSSGFFGDIPRYTHQYREIVYNGGTTTKDYTVVSSEPVSTMDFAQGSPVGYRRVEIYRESYTNENKVLGKEIQEFTDLRDINGDVVTTDFPTTPQEMRGWGLGLPKRVSLYDSAGNLVKSTVNTYQYDSIEYTNNNFKSVKLGNTQTEYFGDANFYSTPKKKTFIGEPYYPANGRIYLTATADTIFQPNGSMTINNASYEYDTNYNMIKIVSSYDRTRGLQKEQRMYYPYHYTVGGTIATMRDSLIIDQPVATETWITGDGNPRIVSGSITSYRQIASGEIKPDTIFSLQSNKPIVQATIGSFDAGKLVRNRDWFKPQVYFSGYSTKGNLSESRDVTTGQYSSIITDYDQQYAIAKVSNAAQTDIAYTSFESAGTGNWTVASTSRNNTDKMTGRRSYSLASGNVSKSSLNSSQKYLLTVWAKSGASFTVNGNSPGTAIASQQGWNFYSVKLTGITSITITGTGTIDELRLHPEDANMITSTYEPLIGVTSTTDANNTIVYNEYDDLNRPSLVRDKDKNIMKRFQYSDTVMSVSLSPQWVYQYETCSNLDAIKDSVYQDMNMFSDSFGTLQQVHQVALNCTCGNAATSPQYRVISGVCEKGVWMVVSSVYKKINFVWVWECTWKYTCFSDGQDSGYSEITYSPTYCGLTSCD